MKVHVIGGIMHAAYVKELIGDASVSEALYKIQEISMDDIVKVAVF